VFVILELFIVLDLDVFLFVFGLQLGSVTDHGWTFGADEELGTLLVK